MSVYHYTSIRKLGRTEPGQHTVTYPSLSDLVQAGREESTVEAKKRYSATIGNPSWHGTRTMREAEELALRGWADGINRITNMSERISESISRRLAAHGMDLWEEGGEVDVASYLDGERACMWTWTEQENKRPVVRVSMNIAASASTTADEYTFAGALAAALVDALESSNRRVELDVIASSQPSVTSDVHLNVVVNLKRAEQPLDMGAIAYSLAHPSMLRRTLFAAYERAPSEWVQLYGFMRHGTYGRVRKTPEELRGDIHIDLNEASRMGFDEGYDWLLERLREQGVEITD